MLNGTTHFGKKIADLGQLFSRSRSWGGDSCPSIIWGMLSDGGKLRKQEGI